MEKKKWVIALICAAVLGLSACGSATGITQEEYDSVVAERDELQEKYNSLLEDYVIGKEEQPVDDTQGQNPEEFAQAIDESSEAQESSGDIVSDGTNTDESIEVLSEYTLQRSSYVYHFMVIRNNSAETVDVSTSSIAYDSDGNVLGADDSSFKALGAGCTSLIYEMLDIEGEVDHYDTSISTSDSGNYESVIQDLSFTQSDIAKGAVFQITNNGEKTAEYVEGFALFIKDGDVVYFDSTYFTDDDSEIKPGATITKQLDSYADFDTIEFYMSGRHHD